MHNDTILFFKHLTALDSLQNEVLVRAIPDAFLGTLLGAWIGTATQVWLKPFETTVAFAAALALIALLLGIISADIKPWAKYLAMFILTLVLAIFGLVFKYVPEFLIFDSDNLLHFFYILVALWVIVSLASTWLHNIIPKQS
jgi:hypothetical protein